MQREGGAKWRGRQALAVSLVVLDVLAGCAATRRASEPVREASAGNANSAATPATNLTTLRTAYGERDDFFEVCESGRPEGLREVSRLAEAGNWDQVLVITQPWVKACPVDIIAHYLTAGALTELGRQAEAEEHIRWYRGLVESVLASGDGRTPETAFVVISVPEEYAVLRALDLRPVKQALQGGIDVFTVESGGGTGIIYFNPGAHFRRKARSLGE
jgi:hypothetical protein